jgi:hypothetical protein
LSQWWRRIEQKRLVDTTVNTFAAEDLLLFLCMHGAKPYHRWSRLIWVTDVAQLIRLQPDLDWEIVLDQAARIGGERRLYFGLLLAANLLGITLPVLVQQRIQADEMVEKLAAQVYAQLFYGVESTAEDLDEFCFYLKTLERRQDQFRAWFYFIVRELIFRWAFRAPPSWLSKLYSRLDRPHARHVWLWPLPLFTLIALFYHLLRPVRQLAKKILRGSA